MKKSIIVLSFILSAVLVSAVLSACKKEIQDTTTTFYGIVSDEETGYGLSNVEVVIYYDDRCSVPDIFGSAVTGSDGYFELIITQPEMDVSGNRRTSVDYELYKKGYELYGGKVSVSLGQGQRYRLDCMMSKDSTENLR